MPNPENITLELETKDLKIMPITKNFFDETITEYKNKLKEAKTAEQTEQLKKELAEVEESIELLLKQLEAKTSFIPYFIFEKQNLSKRVGSITLQSPNDSSEVVDRIEPGYSEITILLEEEYLGKGYGSQAMRSILSIVNNLIAIEYPITLEGKMKIPFKGVQAHINYCNAPSLRMATKSGFGARTVYERRVVDEKTTKETSGVIVQYPPPQSFSEKTMTYGKDFIDNLIGEILPLYTKQNGERKKITDMGGDLDINAAYTAWLPKYIKDNPVPEDLKESSLGKPIDQLSQSSQSLIFSGKRSCEEEDNSSAKKPKMEYRPSFY